MRALRESVLRTGGEESAHWRGVLLYGVCEGELRAEEGGRATADQERHATIAGEKVTNRMKNDLCKKNMNYQSRVASVGQ